MDAINTLNLTKRYRHHTALDRLNLQVAQGELFALLGLNGAGKTTTVKLLSCLSTPTEGDAYVLGHSLRQNPAAVKALIGVSPQETAIAPLLSVEENLMLMGGIHGLSREQNRQRVQELSHRLRLDSVLRQKAKTLSGGWQRRVSIAMALMGDPALLFLDEPTLGLDVLARQELWQVIKELKGTVTVILTTHYMEEAEALSDRIGILHQGRLLVCGTPKELMDSTSTTTVEQAFVALVQEVS